MKDFRVYDLFILPGHINVLLDAQGCLQRTFCIVNVAICANKIVGGQGKLAKREGKV